MEEVFHHLYWSFACLLITAAGMFCLYMIYKMFIAFRILFVREISYYKLKETAALVESVDYLDDSPSFTTLKELEEVLDEENETYYIFDVESVEFRHGIPSFFWLKQHYFEIKCISRSIHDPCIITATLKEVAHPDIKKDQMIESFTPGSIIAFEYAENMQ